MSKIEKEVFTEGEPCDKIGFKDENGGTTSYYSSNVTKDDASMIDSWCQEIGVSPLNTRLFKLSDTSYELRVTSQFHDSSVTPYLKTYQKDNISMTIKAGDFADVMASVAGSMSKALEYASNDNQRNMMKAYVKHF